MVFSNVIAEKVKNLAPDVKDVYEALKPLHIICQITGLAPYKTVQNVDGTKNYKRSIWSLMRCIILLLVFIAGFGILMSLQGSVFEGSIYVRLPLVLDYFVGLTSIISLACGCIFANKIIEVFKDINAIDKEFHELAVWMPYRMNYVAVVFNIIIIHALAIILLTLIFLDTLPQDMALSVQIEVLVLIPLLIFIYIMEAQYVHYLNLLKHRYSVLNEYLEALAREHKSHTGWITDEKDEPVYDSNISKSILKSIEIISNPILVIEKVASLHIKLSDAALLINTAFAVQLLIRITVSFVSIVTALYIIGVNFSSSNNNDDSGINVMFTAWAASSALELLAVVWITNGTCEEANKCPRLMHKIRNSTKNSKLQDVIEMYSLQLYHNRLQFYICGLFPLDYTLLHTIVAGVTTYLVILIQFYSANSSVNANANQANQVSVQILSTTATTAT